MNELYSISVIIPVYNTPLPALERCINSILKQRFNDYEVLILDDGSENCNSESYQLLCERDKRIVYKRHANHGVSYTRNIGINIAQGEYIAFVDADDELSEDFMENAFAEAKEQDADLVVGRIRFIPETKSRQNITKRVVENDMDNVLRSLYALEDVKTEYSLLGSPCGRLYRTELAKSILFDEDVKYWEDQLYNRDFIEQSKIVVAIPEDWYIYYQNEYSAMHKSVRNWNLIDIWGTFFDKWIKKNQKESDAERKRLYDLYLMIYFFVALREEIGRGKKYNRKDIYNLLHGNTFSYFCKTMKLADFNSYRRKFQFILMKNNMTVLLYLFVRIKLALMIR